MSRSEPCIAEIRGAGGILTIDLAAIADNYRRLADRLSPGAECGAVVKADAYGLGLDRVAPTLWAAGCRRFFVAIVEEGHRLRKLLPEAVIYVFNGVEPETAPDMEAASLIPVLNHPGQVEAWTARARASGRPFPAMIHVDTGMNRLGFSPSDVETLAACSERLAGLSVREAMTHLACAEDPEHPLNEEQLDRFRWAMETLAPLGPLRASLANSSAIFLPGRYHFDLARPGSALYGVHPQESGPNPMAQVVTLQGRILQTRRIDSPATVGYGATHSAERGIRIATIGVGYGDGYLRSLSNSASAFVGGVRVPLVGRVSMDLITIDVSALPEDAAHPGSVVELIGRQHTADDLAREAGTIAYEILTALGRRFTRRYVGGNTG